MTATTEFAFHPRTVALARAERAAAFGHVVGSAAAALLNGISALAHRIAQDRRRRHDLALLMQMDARLLADIGLTRGEVAVAARGGFWGGPDVLAEANARREAASEATQKVRALRPKAPAIVPSGIAVRSPRKAA